MMNWPPKGNSEKAKLKKELDNKVRSQLDEMNAKLDLLVKRSDAKEQVIVVREISNEEAMRTLKEEVLPAHETLSTLDIAEALSIPLDQAHILYIQLLEEGILRLD